MADLDERDFIHEEYSRDPYPFWFWLVMLALISALLWGGRSWYLQWFEERVEATPFLQVTNRDLSVFLWQNPSYMRVHASSKVSYLPAFRYTEKVSADPELSDQFVVAPPEVLFRYHVWDRLVSKEFAQRPILAKEFREFLEYDDQWKPLYWAKAPDDYVKLILALRDSKDEEQDIHEKLPLVIQQAFQGWKNYMKEGDAVDKVAPTFAEMESFLAKYPHYARNYWRNIVADTVPNYLQTISEGKFDPQAKIAPTELAPFLKAAFFNFQQASAKD